MSAQKNLRPQKSLTTGLSQPLTVQRTISFLGIVQCYCRFVLQTGLEGNVAEQIAPNDNIESRKLMRTSTWCGIVFGLLIVLTALNFVPPVDVTYIARSEVFVSQVRFEQLERLAHRDADYWFDDDTSAIRLMGIRVLDESIADKKLTSSDLNDASGQLLLVELKTRWQRSFSDEQLVDWLDERTQPRIDQVDASLAYENSRAKWKVKLAEHYLARDEHVSLKGLGAGNRTKFTLAAGSTAKPKVGFATLTTEVDSQEPEGYSVGGSFRETEETPSFNSAVVSHDLNASGREQLQQQLLLAKADLGAVQSQWQKRMAGTAGTLEIAQATHLDATSSPIPLWLAASVLILGCCAAASAGWVQHRLQAGRVYDPARVAGALSKSGLPVLGSVELDVRYLTSNDLADRARLNASKFARFIGARIQRISEWALWFWVYMIAFRLVLDPMWRSVLCESPLAALGRVLVGMP